MRLPDEFILDIDMEGIDLVEKAAPLNPFFQVSPAVLHRSDHFVTRDV